MVHQYFRYAYFSERPRIAIARASLASPWRTANGMEKTPRDPTVKDHPLSYRSICSKHSAGILAINGILTQPIHAGIRGERLGSHLACDGRCPIRLGRRHGFFAVLQEQVSTLAQK